MKLLIEITFDPSLINGFHWLVVVVGMSVVYIALTLLWLFFQGLTRIQDKIIKRNAERALKKKMIVSSYTDVNEVQAAIGMALHLYFNEMHDEEKYMLTINKVSKAYSPWSSKIYTVLNLRGKV